LQIANDDYLVKKLQTINLYGIIDYLGKPLGTLSSLISLILRTWRTFCISLDSFHGWPVVL